MVQLDEPISRKLLQLAKTYLSAFSKRIEHLDLNRYHYMLVLIAENQGHLTQKKIAEITGKDKSHMVSIIDTLAEKGYVYREVNPDDRRQQLIRITEKAENELPAIRESFSLLNSKATEGISADKLRIFNEVLQQMSGNLIPYTSANVTFRLKKTTTLTRKK
ncbi:MarR family winged helix-turn-helix transcriptional regulator [Mucilaginibacter sp. AW1-3]